MRRVALRAFVVAFVAASPFIGADEARAQAGPPAGAPLDSGAVRGVVVDAVDKQPLTAARVRIVELHREELTHENGQFLLPRVPAGRYTLSVHRIGYAVASRAIVVPPGDDAEIRIEMRPAAVQLSQIVVTGGIAARSVEETLQPTNVVSQQELDRKLGTTIGVTLQDEPGVSVASQGPATARPVVRGLGGDRIIVLEDGARSGDLSSSTTDHAVAIDPITATQLEVVRGPATLLYGSNALGGVVNVIRQEIPTSLADRAHGVVTVQGQSVNSGGSAGALLNGSAGDVALRLEGSVRDAGNLRTPVGRLENSGLRTYNAGAGVGWVADWGHLGGAGRYFQSRYGIPPAEEGHEEGVEIEMERWVARGSGERHWSAGALSSAKVDMSYTRYHHREIESGGEIGTEFGLLTAQTDGLARHRAIGPFTEGAFGFRAQWRDYAAAGSQGNPPTNDYALSGFLLEQFGTGALQMQAGVRYDWHRVVPHPLEPDPEIRTRSFGAISGSIGGLYEIGGGVRVGASVSRAFRAPDLTELYSEGPHLAVFRDERGNPDLEEEVGLGVDAFIRFNRDRVDAEAAVFRNQIDDYIHARNTGVPSPRNPAIDIYQYVGGDALLTGAEGNITWNVAGSVVAEGTISYVRGELRTTGEPLPMIPPLNGRLAVRMETPRWFGGVGMRVAAEQNRVAELEEPTDGFVVFDATLGARWDAFRRFHTLTLRLDNVLDEEYREHLSSLKALMPEPGRGVSVLYRLTF